MKLLASETGQKEHPSFTKRIARPTTLGIAAIVFVVLSFPYAPCAAVEVWLTRGDRSQLLAQQPALSFSEGSGSGGFAVNLDAAMTYQTMQGFGAALTDSSAWLIENKLSSFQRNQLMQQLFSPQSGIGMSFMRIPMGASDFTASGRYTYNDLPSGQTDPTQSQFSIAHDLEYIVPQLQAAKLINPSLKLMGSPWSAPAWMKTNQSLLGGQLSPQWEGSYALYLQKFVEAYEAVGLPIDAITLQNEPLHVTGSYPSMGMSSTQQASIIKNHLGPAFQSAGIETDIVIYDHNWDNTNYAISMLNDPQVKQYVAGTAFHAYGGHVSAQSVVHNAHPDRDIYFTEISGGDFAPNFSDNLVWSTQNIIIGNARNWGNSAIFWNLALDENHGPRQGGCSDCRGVVTINSNSGQVEFNEEYYTIAHASKFVQPGAVRIQSASYDNLLETVAFKNPDGSRVLIALNPTNNGRQFRLIENGQNVSYSLPGKSVATFTWPGDGGSEPSQELLFNPGFENAGAGWSSTGQTGFHAFFGDNGHASLFTDNVANSGSVFQTGIAAQPGQIFRFELSDTRIEANANANVRFGLEFWGVNESNKIGEELVQIELPGYEVNHAIFSMTGTAPAGAQFVRPIAIFDSVAGNGSQRNIFIFEASLMLVSESTSIAGDFDLDGDVDGRDFLLWQRGDSPKPFSATDLANWQQNYGWVAEVAASMVIPEPRSFSLCLLIAIGVGPLRLF